MGLDILRGDFIQERYKPIVDVVVSVGYTPKRGGAPTNTDRFYVMHPVCTDTVSRGGTMGGRRDFARGFEKINRDGSGGLTEVTGTLMHAKIDDAMDSGFACAKPPKRGVSAPPGQQMWCSSTGDGRAKRWGKTDSGELGWKEGPCPERACPFYVDKKCKAHTSATFTLRLDGYPNVRAYWSTQGIGTMRNIKTWLTSVEREWAEHMKMGPAPQTPMWWLGMPVRLFLDKVKRKHGETGDPKKDWRKYPEINITNAVPLDEWFKHLLSQMEETQARLANIAAGRALPEPPPASDVHKQLEPHGRTTMSGGKLLSPSPLVLEEDATPEIVTDDPETDGLNLIDGTPKDAEGWPLCPVDSGQMERDGLSGFKCCDPRCSGRRGARGEG